MKSKHLRLKGLDEDCYQNEDQYFDATEDMASIAASASKMPGAKDIVVRSNNIVVIYDYPFDTEYKVWLKSKTGKGFTQEALLKAIVKAYRTLYNKLDRQGKVWGHYFEDLALEGIMQKAPCKFELQVGS
jgi:hypothetical protein